MSYNTKNYTEQGGDVTHIGGKLIFDTGAEVEGFPLQAAAVADSTATSTAAIKEDFNGLLAALRTAGLLASS